MYVHLHEHSFRRQALVSSCQILSSNSERACQDYLLSEPYVDMYCVDGV